MLLDQTAAYPARGFEWYYWQREANLGLKLLRGHTGCVSAVAFAPDGSRIVTGSYVWFSLPLAEMNWSIMPQFAPTNSFSTRWQRRASTGPG